MKKQIKCPTCGTVLETFKNPIPTVDIIIIFEGKIILIKRRNPPLGYALPGGFVDYGESLEQAALREAKEETGLDVLNLRQFRAYSDPARDSRQHNISIVFWGISAGEPQAGDDAEEILLVDPLDIDKIDLAFDHNLILKEFIEEILYLENRV
ncbi:NUDIX hydrolase [bacterium]|nr:NUDIX hydrolase [bacterium]